MTSNIKAPYPITFRVDIAESRTFNIGNNTRAIIDVVGSSSAAKGTIYVYCSSTGAVSADKEGLSGATLTNGTNTLTVSGISAQSFVRLYGGAIG